MTAAMAGFTAEDMFLKAAVAAGVPTGQCLMIMGLAGAVLFAALCLRQGARPLHPAMVGPPMLARSALEIAGRLFHALAIAMVPFALTSAILQATPLVVLAGAALIFGETVGWRRWLAVAVGFAGVLVILRPGVEGFDLLSLLAVAGMAGFAGRDLATRAAPATLSNMQLGVLGFAMLTVAGALILGWTGGAVLPDARGAALVAGMTLAGVFSYAMLTAAMRMGEMSVVAPFRYTRLVFALAVAVAVFGERLDAPMLAGAALIVGSGLYTLFRSRRLARR